MATIGRIDRFASRAISSVTSALTPQPPIRARRRAARPHLKAGLRDRAPRALRSRARHDALPRPAARVRPTRARQAQQQDRDRRRRVWPQRSTPARDATSRRARVVNLSSRHVFSGVDATDQRRRVPDAARHGTDAAELAHGSSRASRGSGSPGILRTRPEGAPSEAYELRGQPRPDSGVG